MKILMVSMPSLHFFRWTDQLKNSDHEIYWFDIVDGSPTEKLPWVKKINGWKVRYPNVKGRYLLKKKLPFIYNLIKPLFERNTAKEFEKALEIIEPDVVHSFVLYISCWPIFSVMKKRKNIRWIYSSWGSDLYYFQHNPNYLAQIKLVLPRVDYMFSDCLRDKRLAEELGFKGEFLGVFPGGGGYDIKENDNYVTAVDDRNMILVKGYQGRSGRALSVIKAIEKLSMELKSFTIIVFGADEEVENYIQRNDLKSTVNLIIHSKSAFIKHNDLMKLMGKAFVYIGNSDSDGIPNTLLEAIIMGAFPIQSNPGGATEEVIIDGKNGFLIEDCEDQNEIYQLLKKAIHSRNLIRKAFLINQKQIKPKLDRTLIADQVLSKYYLVGKR